MDQIKIRNLRSLRDTGYIDIKPLTILVGKNSSGKSTFLRFFPLMKQTLSTKKNEPILWYSKENVDFGSFSESINRNSKENIIGFDFKFKIRDSNHLGSKRNELTQLSLSVDLKEKSLSRISISIFNNQINFLEHNDVYKLLINDVEVREVFSIYRPNVFDTFLPEFKAQENERENDKHSRVTSVTDFFTELLYQYALSTKQNSKDDKEFQSKLYKDIKHFLRILLINNHFELILKKDIHAINELLNKYPFHEFLELDFLSDNSELGFDSLFNNIDIELKRSNKKSNEVVNILTKANNEEYEKIKRLILGIYIDKLIEFSNDYLTSYFSQVHYIAPIRASAQRYYRLQGLAVDEIDPQGENIPMAINHLSSSEKWSFKNWTKTNFGFEIETKENGGHVNLNISFGNNENINLADTGFGFSQVLPILLLLWRVENKNKASKFRRKVDTYNIVIEQPELHLHPALQARLTDALIKCIEKASNTRIPINIIIETHSETIVNRVGQLIYKGQISKEKINVLIFGDLESQNPSETCLTSVSFDEEGVIEDWPLGFFYPEV